MKHTLSLIALVAICSAMMVSCKNNKQSEPNPEEIEAQKVALADSVLAEIDAFAEEYIVASDNEFFIRDFIMSDKEKQIKPTYLLDPSESNNFITKTQKVNALAIYILEMYIRKIYDMPIDESKEVIAKLSMDVNYYFDSEKFADNVPTSEIIRAGYEKCKENNELTLFWQFQNAISFEISYLFAQNPDLFSNNISDEQWRNFNKKKNAIISVVKELAQYDEEMSNLQEFCIQYNVTKSIDEMNEKDNSIESAKQFFIANKDKYIANRNALLQ